MKLVIKATTARLKETASAVFSDREMKLIKSYEFDEKAAGKMKKILQALGANADFADYIEYMEGMKQTDATKEVAAAMKKVAAMVFKNPKAKAFIQENSVSNSRDLESAMEEQFDAWQEALFVKNFGGAKDGKYSAAEKDIITAIFSTGLKLVSNI